MSKQKVFKKAKVNNEKNWKWKLKMNEIAGVTEKTKAVASTIKNLEPDIVGCSIAAEEKIDLLFLDEANSFCYTLCKKRKLISEVAVLLKNQMMSLRIFTGTWRSH